MTTPAHFSNVAVLRRPVKLNAAARKAAAHLERDRQASTKRRIDSIAGRLDALESSASSLTVEIERLEVRRNTICRCATRTEERLIGVIARAGVKELFGFQRTLERKENAVSKLIVDDESKIPHKWMRQPKPPKPVPDKIGMKDALEKDPELAIPGVHLGNTVSLVRK